MKFICMVTPIHCQLNFHRTLKARKDHNIMKIKENSQSNIYSTWQGFHSDLMIKTLANYIYFWAALGLHHSCVGFLQLQVQSRGLLLLQYCSSSSACASSRQQLCSNPQDARTVALWCSSVQGI